MPRTGDVPAPTVLFLPATLPVSVHPPRWFILPRCRRNPGEAGVAARPRCPAGARGNKGGVWSRKRTGVPRFHSELQCRLSKNWMT